MDRSIHHLLVIEAPALAVLEVQPVPDKTHTHDRKGVAAVETAAGDGRTGRGTEPGKLPGCAAPTAPDALGAGAAEDAVVPSVPKAPSWRD